MKIVNRRASYDYVLQDHFEAGVNLLGAEVKAVRQGHVDLAGSYAKIMGSEVYLLNAKIYPYEYARPESYNTSRTRKLLLHKKQIISLKSKMEGSRLTLVPVSMYTKHHLIKVELALGKSKKKVDKKEDIKRRDIEREIKANLKNLK